MNNYDYVQKMFSTIILVCLVYLAFNSMPLFLTVVAFQMMLGGFVLWRGVRDEVQDGNKQ